MMAKTSHKFPPAAQIPKKTSHRNPGKGKGNDDYSSLIGIFFNINACNLSAGLGEGDWKVVLILQVGTFLAEWMGEFWLHQQPPNVSNVISTTFLG